jgi:ATP-dependent RNA helicase DeaD
MNKFEQLGLSESLLKAILDLGFENPTEVESDSLYWKRHRYGCVGSDRDREKQHLDFRLFKKHTALILSPTRELCLQITNEIKNYSKYEKRY